MSEALALLISHRGRHVATGNRGARDILNIHTLSDPILKYPLPIGLLNVPWNTFSWLLANTHCGAIKLPQGRALAKPLQRCALFDRRRTAVLDYPVATPSTIVGEILPVTRQLQFPPLPTLSLKLRSICLQMVRDTHEGI